MKKKNEFTPIDIMSERPKLTECDVSGYVLEKFQDLKNEPSMEGLVNFQTKNKYLIMSHSQFGLKELGNIVANHEKLSIKIVLKNYEKTLLNILKKEPTIKSNMNVLMHIFGYFRKCLNQKDKTIFLQFVNEYRENKMTLGKILSEIEPITYKFNNLYLMNQTYFLLYSEAKRRNMFKM